MTKHKWHKEIKAWADGAEIEFRTYTNGKWGDWAIDNEPDWYVDNDWHYRIKPAECHEASQPKEPHEVSERYGKAMQQSYEDGFVQGITYMQTGQVSDGKKIPKEPQYLYVYKLHNSPEAGFRLDENYEAPYAKCVGKIKLEQNDE